MTTDLIRKSTQKFMAPQVKAWDPHWLTRFTSEADRLRRTLGTTGRSGALDIQHIGGTAVRDLAGTDTIDILLITPDLASFDARRSLFTRIGYRSLGDGGRTSQRKFVLGPDNDQKVLLYVYQPGNTTALHHLLVRDFLRSHPKDRDSYSALKQKLAQRQPSNATGYRPYYSEGKRPRLTRLLEQATGRR